MGNAAYVRCGQGDDETEPPQRHRIAGFAAVVVVVTGEK